MPTLDPSIGVDLSFQMLRQDGPGDDLVNGDMMQLPFRRESFGGVWASRTLVHIPLTEAPIVLAELHRVLRTGTHASFWVFEGDQERGPFPDDPLPGRTFSLWPPQVFERALIGAGFAIEAFDRWTATTGYPQITATVTREWSLPDYVAGDMKVLICGLNPSPSSADSGVGFFKAGNRFWPAALQAGLVSRDRDPRHALTAHGIGMTDMVKRPTRRADELDRAEYQLGVERLQHLVAWLQPEVVCMVGLAGWRAAVDRKAQRGWQPDGLGGRPVYLMPSTSGLNAHDTVDTLAEHLRLALAGT